MDLMGHSLTPSDYLEMKGAYMSNGIFNVPTPQNEPVFAYAPGSPERASPWPTQQHDSPGWKRQSPAPYG